MYGSYIHATHICTVVIWFVLLHYIESNDTNPQMPQHIFYGYQKQQPYTVLALIEHALFSQQRRVNSLELILRDKDPQIDAEMCSI